MIQKVTHPQSIYKMLQILGILLYHIATNQLATIKSQVTGVYMIRKNTKKNETHWKLARSVLPSTYHTPTVRNSDFVDVLKFRY